MDILNLIYFSPTGTTKKIVRAIGQKLGIGVINEYNILPSKSFGFKPEINKNSLTIIGIPVYGGRLPLVVLEGLEKIQSNGTPVVLVVVYGNRAYEDSLLELKNIAVKCGFRIIAAAAFIGEHSFSTKNKPIAKDRPDGKDILRCTDFSQSIQEKIKNLVNEDKLPDIDIYGNYPYKKRSQSPLLSPGTNIENCTKCKICEDICPTNAITINNEVETNPELCIWCCACVKACPNDARFFDNPTINGIIDKLSSTCKERKEPEFFL